MGKMEETLRAEIRRLTRKEMRASVNPLSQEMRQLKRTVNRLLTIVERIDQSAIREVRSPSKNISHPEVSRQEVKSARLSPRVIRNLRKRLGISQGALAVVLDVSPGAVASWEQNRALPRGKNKKALVALRKVGRRDVKRILAERGWPQDGRKRTRSSPSPS